MKKLGADVRPKTLIAATRQIEGREWWLWGFAVTVTLVLTLCIVSLTFSDSSPQTDADYWRDLRGWVRGLAGLVLLFDIYTIYQHFLLQRIRRQVADQDELFQLISENAADMIAVVDSSGRRLYNSPAYQRVLGYSAEELSSTSSIEQIHPDDRSRVLEAAAKARLTGRGERLEYRILHKDGSWHVLESTASVIRKANGESEKIVIVNRDITERKRAEESLAHNAFHDGLTNLPNRDLFVDRLKHAFALSRRRHSGYKFAVLFVDVDEFRVFNDSLGHSAGDGLLIQIGRRLTASLRDTDVISRPGISGESDLQSDEKRLARVGGDEFTALLEDIRDLSDAIRVAERIQERLAIPFIVDAHEIVITASVGIALSATSYTEADELLRDAEIAMYRAKRAGKARCEVFDKAMHAAAVKRLRLESDLRKALERGEFQTHYQPIVSLRTGRVSGFEALTRWQRPEGLVMPADFISVADETGIILPMNRLLMREACQQLRTWHSQFPTEPPLTMSVNITPKQFAQPELASEVGEILKSTGINPATLELEITENIAMADAERSGHVLSNLRALGVHLSIDDFGTGYSSLSRLRRFPVDALKIDRTFICDIDTDKETREIVRTIVMLAQTFGLKVVAEGVETKEQLAELKKLDCELAQGYLFAKPADQATIRELLMRAFRANAGGARAAPRAPQDYPTI
jgi:PAS domain S-box-containing protein